MSKQYILDLEYRVKVIEVELSGLRATRPSQQLDSSNETDRTRGHDSETGPNRSHGNDGIEVNKDELHDAAEAEDVTDGMVAVIFSDEEDFGFYGKYQYSVMSVVETGS